MLEIWASVCERRPGESGDTRAFFQRKSPTVPTRTQATGASRYVNGCEKDDRAYCHLIDAVSHLADVTDRMHGLLMERADALMGCLEGSAEKKRNWRCSRISSRPTNVSGGRKAKFRAARAEAAHGGRVVAGDSRAHVAPLGAQGRRQARRASS